MPGTGNLTAPYVTAWGQISVATPEEEHMAMTDSNRFGDWNQEDEYWKNSYSSRPYSSGSTYDTWRPAYRFGYESAQRYQGRQWSDVERDLERDWDTYQYRGDSRSTWQQIKDAARDAWDRVTGNR
jgi:hypothetical protein